MLFVLSPAKALNYTDPTPDAVAQLAGQPRWLAQSQQLIDLLAPLSPQQVAQLMHLSDKLAQLNTARYAAWQPECNASNSRPAVLAFDGDVYDGLQAAQLNLKQLVWAQEHLAILSGLYGVLRPLDWMQPYRLEMGTALSNKQGRNLYQFWGDTLRAALDQQCANTTGDAVIVNLASQEYFKAAQEPDLKHPVVHCVFEEMSAGKFKIISFFAKKARGLMMRWAIENQIQRRNDLQNFAQDGYAYAPSASTPQRLVFRRTAQP